MLMRIPLVLGLAGCVLVLNGATDLLAWAAPAEAARCGDSNLSQLDHVLLSECTIIETLVEGEVERPQAHWLLLGVDSGAGVSAVVEIRGIALDSVERLVQQRMDGRGLEVVRVERDSSRELLRDFPAAQGAPFIGSWVAEPGRPLTSRYRPILLIIMGVLLIAGEVFRTVRWMRRRNSPSVAD